MPLNNLDTFLFDDTIFGPIKSRRYGNSLGINLLPDDHKFCNFDCIYCECGWTENTKIKNKIPTKEKVVKLLNKKLIELKNNNKPIDTITFAGNGEPTLHPDFKNIIKEVVKLRNQYFEKVNICVLTNATLIHKKNISDALKLVDECMYKIDAGNEILFQLINKPLGNQTLEKTVNHIINIKKKITIQSMFLKGEIDGIKFDSTNQENIKQWINIILKINPKKVILYSIDRATPAKNLFKIKKEELNNIADKLKPYNIITEVY